MADRPRKVRFYTVPGFRRSYKRFLPNAQVKAAMRAFNVAKRLIPPNPLPDWMRDHGLHGKLADMSECHLAHDILLIYTHKDDVVTLLDCCTHKELKGAGGEARIRGRQKIANARARLPKHK